jgi:hypothetical protein
MEKRIIDAARGAGFEIDLPEKLGLEVKRFKDLDPEIQVDTVWLYTKRWDSPLTEEQRRGTWLPDYYFMSRNDEMCERIRERLNPLSADDEAKYVEVYKQLKTSSERFPEGQVVLIKKFDDKWKPVVFTRSEPWEITKYTDDEKYFENYPSTWYTVTNNGIGYEWIPSIENEKVKSSRKHEDVFNRENPRWNEDDDLHLINHALSTYPDRRFQVKGAARAAIMERALFTVLNGISECDTHSPLSGYGPWVEKYGPCTVEDYVKMNIDYPLSMGIESDFFDAARMHANWGAEIIKIFKNGRDTDWERTMGYTVACRYPVWKIREAFESIGMVEFDDLRDNIREIRV